MWVIFFSVASLLFVVGGAEETTFDFIIVGGGTSGCLLASRLSENGNYSVLLLESGAMPSPNYDIPALSRKHLGTGENTVVYNSVPQRYASLYTNGSIGYMVGKALGGTSSVNAMVFNRGSPHVYDAWAQSTGDPSWSYENLLQYFKKSENYLGDFPFDEKYHGKGGPITISRPKYSPGLVEWLEAGEYLGYKIVDPNGHQEISFSPVEFSKLSGHRVSSYSAYIKPFLSRPNLHVIPNADVTKLIFDGHEHLSHRVIGVNYTEGHLLIGEPPNIFVRARKEVILSAGVIGSPLLLMKSGIGPKKVLKSAGIPVLKHVPGVGENLQDHLLIQLGFFINDTSKEKVFIPDRDLTEDTFQMYNHTGGGPYSTESGNFGQAFISSCTDDDGRDSKRWADIQLISVNQPFAANTYAGDPNGGNISGVVVFTQPKSRGSVTIDRNGEPLIDFRYLSNSEDIKAWIKGIEVVLDIYEKSLSYQKLGARLSLTESSIEACNGFEFRSHAYWECYLMQFSTSGFHGAGTCKMGKINGDTDAVVDKDLKLIGVDNLRVCDTSVFPQVVNSNTQAAVYAISEKLADKILQKWGNARQKEDEKKKPTFYDHRWHIF